MPELRRDPITHRWSIIATERALRPKTLVQSAEDPPAGAACPFCVGNEHMTPGEIAAVRPGGGPPNGGGWKVRVVPNKFPALRIEGGLDKRPDGIYDHMNGIGAHEVVVECPDHSLKLHELPKEHLLSVLKVYRDRMADLQGDRRFRFSLLFRNHGAGAGATLAHPHAQLIALPVVPAEVQVLLDGSRRYYEFRERNVFDDIVRQELEDGRRVIHEAADFLLLAPYASRAPFEQWIVPRFHATRFERAHNVELERLAEVLKLALSRLDRGLGNPAYNLIVQTAPYGHEDVPWYRWHVQILPKLTRMAGFELGTGFHINPTAPEEAAEFLRGLPG